MQCRHRTVLAFSKPSGQEAACIGRLRMPLPKEVAFRPCRLSCCLRSKPWFFLLACYIKGQVRFDGTVALQVGYHHGCTCILLSCDGCTDGISKIRCLLCSMKCVLNGYCTPVVSYQHCTKCRSANFCAFFFFAHSVQTGCLSRRMTFLFAHGNETKYVGPGLRR